MDPTLFRNALGLVAQLSLALVGGVVAAAVVGAILRTATQIEDPAIGFASRLLGLAFTLYIAAEQVGRTVLEFSQRVWGGADFY